MLFPDLATALGLPSTGLPAVDVTGITHNAAWVGPGSAFVAIRGARADGHDFIPDAVARGAVVVLGEGLPEGATSPVPYVVVPAARAVLADAAAVLAGHPSRRLAVVGVTGTDGKTTTSWLTRHLLRAGGLATGLLSTVGYELPDGVLRHFPAHFTTPEAPQVQELLAEMVAAGGQVAVVEASSHALALDRVRAVDWDVAVWTHLTREHLDFHGTVENYFADKRKLVERAPFAILNADDAWFGRLTGIAPAETRYSIEGAPADWQASDISEGPRGLRFRVTGPVGEFEAELPMIGRFNVANALAGMAAASRLGVGVGDLVAGLASFRGVPGRMELVPARDVRVVVDFAHTPPALEKALGALHASAEGQVWVVVGSAGGRRDPGKHAPMGEVATRVAEHAIFTEDDPSGTPLGVILDEMERGAREEGRANFRRLEDRREAIRFAVLGARPGDTILLAGKGPEETMDRGEKSVPWDEVAEAAAALAERAARG